jgi:magnesium and cobalt transporter
MVTIEDVLEQIVGDIEDEYDYDEDEDNIIQNADGHYRVKALTEIGDFNDAVGTHFSDEEFSTIGGLVVNKFGHMPKRGDSIVIENLSISVLRADSRRLHSIQVEVIPDEPFPIEST